MLKRKSLILGIALLSLAPAGALLSGCGGGSGGGVSGSTGGGVFAGRSFSGVVTFGNQTGRLVISISNSNTATGTFTVATLVRAVANDTYSVTGNVDPNTGAFSLTATKGGTAQTFSISGTLPASNHPGRFTLTDGASTYTGAIEEGTSAGHTGLAITAASGNVNTTALNNLIDSSGTLTSTRFNGLSSDPAASPVRHLDIELQDSTATGGIEAGARFAVNSPDPTFTGLAATAAYRQGTATWNAVSGIIKVTSTGTATVTVEFQNVRFEAETTTGASGGFTLNGSHTYAGITNP